MSGLTFRTRLAYAPPGFALTTIVVPLSMYIPKFYSDVVGVPVAVIGTIMLAGRIVDAVTDPALGMIF